MDDEKDIQKDTYHKCSCGNDAINEHTCPFKEEINNDCESMCNCCEECMHQCAMDI